MKHPVYFAVLVIFLAACRKEGTNELSVNDQPVTNDITPTPVNPYEWTALPNPLADPYLHSQIIPVNGNVFCITGYYPAYLNYKLNNTTKRWELFDDFELSSPGSQYLFSYQSKIYFGLTVAAHTTFRNLYSVDVITGVKTTLAQFPGTAVAGALTFAVDDKGYLLGGATGEGDLINQYWEYNFSANQWIDKGSSPLGTRMGACAFIADNKAYIGLGYDNTSFNGQPIKLYKSDWIQFNPNSAYHAVKTPFPGQKRAFAEGFVLNSSAYLGFGRNNNSYYTDFWKYNPSSNTWTQQASWPGSLNDYTDIGAFSLGNTGYAVKGGLAEFWRFSNSPFTPVN